LAQANLTDGFGILPAQHVSEARNSWAGTQTQDGLPTTVAPQVPETVLFFVGPKSVVAGTEDSHAVAIVLDPFGNLVADGQYVSFVLGLAAVDNLATTNGIADTLFRPEPVSGMYTAGASTASRQSPRAIFRVTTDLSQVSPKLEKTGNGASIETLTTLRSFRLEDAFGNTVEDGVASSIVISHEDASHSLLSPVVLGGRASTMFLTRDIAAMGSVLLVVGANTSLPSPQSLRTIGSLGETDVRLWPIEDLDATLLNAGPFMTDQGHLLVDGAAVSVEIRAASGASAIQNGWVRDGYFDALVPLSPTDETYTVTTSSALGREEVLTILSAAPTNDKFGEAN
jgi:hypothetical protein